MKILAIDTSSTIGGAALLDGEEILAEKTFALKRSASTELMPTIDQLFQESSLKPEELEAIAVTVGPGSFTGIRIGMATAQGIAVAGRLPVYGISSLAALRTQSWRVLSPSPTYVGAAPCGRPFNGQPRGVAPTETLKRDAARHPPHSIAVMRHARQDEFYFCLYDGRSESDQELVPEGRYHQDELLSFLKEAPAPCLLVQEEESGHFLPVKGLPLTVLSVTPRAAAVAWVALKQAKENAYPGGRGLTPRFYSSPTE